MASSKSDIHKEHRIRMRRKFRKNGFDGFEPHEILEILLYYSIPRIDTNPLAHTILDKYKTLANVFDASFEELNSIDGVGEVTATMLTMIPKLVKVYEMSKWESRECFEDINAVGEFAVSLFKDKLKEEVAVICLDANRNIKWIESVVKGTVDRTEAYPREIIEQAIKHQATRIILVHNHPNGTLAPSVADKEATENLSKLLKGIGTELLDHIIVSENRYFSMKEMGFKF